MAAQNGSFQAGAEVDADGTINECEEMNNADSRGANGSDFEFGQLEPTNLTVDDNKCGFGAFDLDISFSVDNSGQSEVPAGVPVEVVAVAGFGDVPIKTVTTSKKLKAGDSESFSFTHTIDKTLQNEQFDVEVTVDPDQKVHACGGQAPKTTRADCRTGG
jgi:hypothetical protein